MDVIEGWNNFGNERNNDENHGQRTGEFHQNRAEGFPDRQRGKFFLVKIPS